MQFFSRRPSEGSASCVEPLFRGNVTDVLNCIDRNFPDHYPNIDQGFDRRKKGEGVEYHSAATPARLNMSSPPSSSPSTSFALVRFLRSKLSHTSFQLPRVAALEYSVARVSKKLACSTPFSSGASHGSGCSSIM